MKVLLSFYDHLMISFAFNFNVMHISQHILIVHVHVRTNFLLLIIQLKKHTLAAFIWTSRLKRSPRMRQV